MVGTACHAKSEFGVLWGAVLGNGILGSGWFLLGWDLCSAAASDRGVIPDAPAAA